MNANDVTDALMSIPIGTYVAWITVIAGFVAGASAGVIKLYKIFLKYHATKEENQAFHELVKKHDDQLAQILCSLNQITKTLEEKRNSDLKRLRHSIIRAGEEAIRNEYITIRELRSLNELFDEYENKYHANGYVKTLMKKVGTLKVIGRLDENDEDIEEG